MTFKGRAKELNLKYYDVDMGMFDFTVRLVVGDYEKSLKLIRWFHGVDWITTEPRHPPRGEMFYTAPFVPIIWLPRKPRTAEELGTFAHECVHAIVAMFQWANMPIDLSTNETFAHAVGYLVSQFKKALQ